MSARSTNLSIDTQAAAAARRALPSPLSSTTGCPPEEEMVSTATLSHPQSLSIPNVPYPSSQHHRQQSMYEQQQYNRSHRDQMPTTPATPSSSTPVVRHPLWRLQCSSCKSVLCEQAMQGHLVGDPSKKLFSTNQAIGVLGLPDRPVSIICPCKFHMFACASCGSICGYNLSQPCTGCETNRGNGHFWIFYAHEIVAQWRTIGDRNMFWDDLPTWSSKPDGNVGR
ncbi:Protein fam72a [Lunasporangiospora selenospora]|uniref:Protein fam72a n=1 Tax=Lunasporangiospora selenospora TaxID=979761 RepID=A0A9P6KIJ7_9FUNG|nr:Protein fam72a [Lunasporangiospora selenospora]